MADSAIHGIDRIGGSQRIASLDVIRGIAILCILFMNIGWMAAYGPIVGDPRAPGWSSADQSAFVFMRIYLDGTQRGLLQLLFGAGIMIMARKAMKADGPVGVADLHYRRNLLLIAFGLFNALVLLWPGDILLPYGLAAIFLFPARLLRPRSQIILGFTLICMAAIPSVLHYSERSQMQSAAAQVRASPSSAADPEIKELAAGWDKAVKGTAPIASNPAKQQAVKEIHDRRMGPLLAYAKGQWEEWKGVFEPDIFFWLVPEAAGAMLIGAALFQLGIIQGQASTKFYWGMLAIAYLLGFTARISGMVELFQFSAAPKLYWLTDDLSRLAMTLGHLAAIHLVLRSATGRLLLKPFQAAGRMPLTTYLFTSFLTMWVLFPGIGFGLHARWSHAGMMACATTIIALEIVATNLWLRRFETGPVEWLWKSLAYGKRQPYRRAEAATEPALMPAE